MSSGRTLNNTQSFQFNGSEVLILRITDSAGAVLAEETFTEARAEYRLEKTGLELGKVFRALAIFKDTNLNDNQTTSLDLKEFLNDGQNRFINLALGHVGTIRLEIPSVDYSIYPSFQSENFTYSGYSTNNIYATFLDLYFDNSGHADTLTSFQFRFNNQPWQERSLDGFEYEQFTLESGLNILEVRYNQESDHQWILYRFTVQKN